MLGKLFNRTPGASSSQNNYSPATEPPESVQEEIHTRGLLFPDTQTLYSRQDQVFTLSTSTALGAHSPSNYDYDGELDLDVRDVRVIVMQDSLGAVNPSLLYDSHPAPPVPATEARHSPSASHSQTHMKDLRRNPATSRKTSLSHSRPMVIQPDSPQPRQGAFDRRSSFQARTYTPAENEAQRANREYREELASFTSCIFANTEVMSYKGTSTKVHIVPSDARPEVSSSLAGDGKGSIGRSSMRSSRLSQSFTAESAAAAFAQTTPPGKLTDRKKVLVTRLFPVNLPTDDPETPNTGVTPHSRASEDGSGFPFPLSPDETGAKKKKPQPKQKRTPMYAVALVLQLPSSPTHPPPSAAKSTFRSPSSFTEQDSFSSSFSSARRSGWTMVGAGYGADSIESSYSNEVDDKMDAVTQHWDIIMRTLTHLQSIVATTLFPMLKQADHIAPDPHQPSIAAQVARNPAINGRRGSNASQMQMKPPKTNAKLVTLPPNCLMQDQQINREIDAARVRIVTGLRATRVVTGQGRWGPWREEARWVAKYAGGKEQGFFFFNILTGFLATHTDWLQALSPVWYRRRHYQQQKAKNEEDTSLPSRTIIVSNDKMAARRLIFLLSAFLPANQQVPTIRPPKHASTSFSQSPPSFVIPILKEESLRRKINRRPTGQRGAGHQRSFSIQSQATTRSAFGIPAQLDHLSMDAFHGRRPSDATLFKPTALSSQGSDATTRKSSAATTNTIVPDAAVPHFTSVRRSNTRRSNRPGSSGSVAADDLKRTLTRGDSSGQGSMGSTDSHRRSSNWGSVISGLWSARRRESVSSTTQTLDFPMSRDSGLGSPIKAPGQRDKLSEMVNEGSAVETPTKDEFDRPEDPVRGGADQPDTPRTLERRGLTDLSEASKRTPDPLGAFESPVKTSISADDGVIDVDVVFPDYLTSFESAISSPSSSGYLSTSGAGAGIDSFEQFSRVAIDGEAPLNVAGWLQQFHPDFALQAIPPQPDLLERVKESLRAEPTPSYPIHQLPVEWPTEQWVDVSSAIIADTATFSIKRLKFRRLVKAKLSADRSSGPHLSGSMNPYSSSLMTPALSPYEQPLKEIFEEEVLFTWDEALIDAVEKVIAQVVHGSQESSTTNSSRSVSKRREGSESDASEPGLSKPTASHVEAQEVPRAECKTVVLSALENIVQEVVDQREKEGHSPTRKVVYETKREKESVLRSAVRTWLESVEQNDGAWGQRETD
ncbi:putative Folliculin-interacting protein N-terminal domain-containing protein [Seiridium unicorne]|uniref:Folliculin-interacting protein N-terminal domain-containing protein n=1 Tax=Seiridium unicorne TaxID=138068 RepID=A0ABR2VF50_9PEZI